MKLLCEHRGSGEAPCALPASRFFHRPSFKKTFARCKEHGDGLERVVIPALKASGTELMDISVEEFVVRRVLES